MDNRNINKDLLIRFFRGEASESEVDELMAWVESSRENKEEFAKEKAKWIIMSSRMESETDPNEEAEILESMISRINEEYASNRKKSRNTLVTAITCCAAAAVIVLLVLLDMRKAETPALDRPLMAENTATPRTGMQPPTYTIYTNKGTKGFLTLPDSSRVWLNSDTEIEYPQYFSGEKRVVKISGEAYLEVMTNPDMPMQIITPKGLNIEVKGTRLSVKCYDNDDEARTTLYSGKIELQYPAGNGSQTRHLTLEPSESFILKTGAAPVHIRRSNTEKQIAWKNGTLIFENTPMKEVIKMIERWHGAEFCISNEKIYQYRISASFESESLVQVMNIIQMMIPVKIKVEKNKVTIS